VANPGALFRATPKTCIVVDLISGEIKPIIVPIRTGDSSHTRPGLAASGVHPAMPNSRPTPPDPPMSE
jgi:hypothetical protein